MTVTETVHPVILAPDEGPAAEVFNPAGRAPVCVVCEHASAFIPAALGELGLAAADRLSHAVWDIGAGDLARHLAELLDAPLVLSRVSRLVHDCNRPPGAADATPARTERIEVPGNRDLTDDAKAARAAEVYAPFAQTLRRTLDGFDTPPALVTVHSFAPVWFGRPRAVELGLLHDADDRLARAMLAAAPRGLRTELNAPYSARDGVTHTLAEHAIPRGLDNVMIEVRNDLLAGPGDPARMAAHLHGLLTATIRSTGGEAA